MTSSSSSVLPPIQASALTLLLVDSATLPIRGSQSGPCSSWCASPVDRPDHSSDGYWTGLRRIHLCMGNHPPCLPSRLAGIRGISETGSENHCREACRRESSESSPAWMLFQLTFVQTGTKNTEFKIEQVKEAFMDPK